MNCKGNLNIKSDSPLSGLEILAERGRIIDMYKKLERDPFFPDSLSLENYPLAKYLIGSIKNLREYMLEFCNPTEVRGVVFNEYLPNTERALDNSPKVKFSEKNLDQAYN